MNVYMNYFININTISYRDLDLPLSSDPLRSPLLSLLFLSLFDPLLPLRFESRLRERDFSERLRLLERDAFFSAGDFERLPRDFERLSRDFERRDERCERDLI